MDDIMAKKRVTRNYTGCFAWLNDIEISKVPYLATIIMMLINVMLVRQPFLVIRNSYLGEISYALHELPELDTLCFAAVIMGCVSIFTLLVPLIKFFEWKYRWILPTTLIMATELIGVAYVLRKVQMVLEKTLVGYAYEMLSVEISLTSQACVWIVINILVLVCSLKMLADIRTNEKMY